MSFPKTDFRILRLPIPTHMTGVWKVMRLTMLHACTV